MKPLNEMDNTEISELLRAATDACSEKQLRSSLFMLAALASEQELRDLFAAIADWNGRDKA